MPPAIIPVNKNRARVHVVWGINTILRKGQQLPKEDELGKQRFIIFILIQIHQELD